MVGEEQKNPVDDKEKKTKVKEEHVDDRQKNYGLKK